MDSKQGRKPPDPVTREESYFAAILEELIGLRADLAERAKPINIVNQAETTPKRKRKGQ